MIKFLHKRVSTLIGIMIILVAAGILLGGAFTYQYFAIKEFNKTVFTTGVLPAVQKASNTNF